MKVAVCTTTRDRLAYTKMCFRSLVDKAGCPFDWLVLDNGSTDGSKEWLQCYPRLMGKYWYTENQGLSKSYNVLIKALIQDYDYIVHFDNDCLVLSENILAKIMKIYENPLYKDWVLSPQVAGISTQIMRTKMHLLGEVGDAVLGEVPHVGHIFMCVPSSVYKEYLTTGGYPETLPKGMGQDTVFCQWLQATGHKIANVENLVVQHFEGTHAQAVRFPLYHARKIRERTE